MIPSRYARLLGQIRSRKNDFESALAEAWEAGLNGQIPKPFQKEAEAVTSNDPEWAGYCRLREKFLGKALNFKAGKKQPRREPRRFFNDQGELLPGPVFGDPYRRPEKNDGTVSWREFDDDGNPSPGLLQEAQEVCRLSTASALCLAAQIVFSAEFGSNTKGSYPAMYFWR